MVERRRGETLMFLRGAVIIIEIDCLSMVQIGFHRSRADAKTATNF